MGIQQPPHLLASSVTASQLAGSSDLDAAAPPTPKERLDILRHFDAVFSESPASVAEDLQEAFHLRYLVYCLDRGFEDAGACPSGLEQDPYDRQALHCLLRERFGKRPIGTVRLVTTKARPTGIDGLPLAEYASSESLDILRSLPQGSTAEVSRFAIARAARDILCQSQGTAALPSGRRQDPQRNAKLLPYMSLGLIRGLVRLSVQHGIAYWCLAAEPSLLRRLRAFGLHFQNAGPLVEHRGLRQVCYANLKDLLARAEAERPEFWDIITVGGFLLSDALVRNAA